MDYREYSPCAALAPFIQCYWTLRQRCDAPPAPSRVFPDGCMEIVFHFDEPFSRVHGDGRVERQSQSLLAGQIWTPLTLQSSRRADVLGIRFRPAGAMPFLRFPLYEASGKVLPLDDAWGRRAQEWGEALCEARDRIAEVERRLLACRPVAAARGGRLSERQFRRRFRAEVGLPPKLFERIRRFQRALAVMGTGTFAATAAACGYYDQSHLIRDFVQFTGASPSAWLASSAHVLMQPGRGDAGRVDAGKVVAGEVEAGEWDGGVEWARP